MLKALYDYAIRHQLTLPPGYVNKTVKAWIWLKSDDPSFLEVLPGDEAAIPCPDIGSMANSKEKCNVLVEKRSVVFPEMPTPKNHYFLDALHSAAQAEPLAGVCYAALQSAAAKSRLCNELNRHNIKDSDRVSFKVDETFLPASDQILVWWSNFRQQFQKQDGTQERCLITGELTVPITTAQSVVGLKSVGGHASGDSLICFDKNAFCSYGLKQAANAPVSDEAYSAVKAALDQLLKGAQRLAGMKIAHWYDKEIPPGNDPVFAFLGDANEEDEEAPSQAALQQIERDAVRAADRLVSSVTTGEQANSLHNRYYILMLTGVTGRVMIRRYEQGSYEELIQRLKAWEEDISLTNSLGTADMPPCKLTARLLKLLSYKKAEKNLFDRMAKELSGVTPAVISSILSGAPLPDTVAARALGYIRSRLMAAAEEENTTDTAPDARACQWLKAWLLRKNPNTKEWLMNTYNPNARQPAYYCGAMMAVYAAIQQRAMGDVNATVVQRYYGSAIQTPALVLGRLSRQSTHHLEKLDRGLASIFQAYLEELNIGLAEESIPATLSLEEQSEFSLGYYQMSARMKQDMRQRIAERKEKEEK